MGTRHIIIIKIDNEYKVTQYGQWDGYPEHAGIETLKQIKKILKSDKTKTKFLNNLRKLKFYTKEELDIISNDQSCEWNEFYKTYPQLSRDTSYKIFDMILENPNDINEFKLLDNLSFVGDSIWCEFGYVIDFDLETFEVYEGFNKIPLTEEDRFYHIPIEDVTQKRGYFQIKIKEKFNFDNLPTEKEFLKKNFQTR